MVKSILMIGGSRLQLPALRWAREAGLRIVLADRDPRAVGRTEAHAFEAIPGDDVDALVALACSLQKRSGLAGAYASGDFALRAIAAIGAATGTCANPLEAVENALDKGRAKALWRERGIATPRGRIVKTPLELLRAIAEIGLPAIVKPTSSSGSRGVRTIERAEEALHAFNDAEQYSGEVLIEERASGEHLDVNGFFRDGVFIPAGILVRWFTPPPTHVPVHGLGPVALDEGEKREIYALVENAARALGLTVGPIKADVVRTGKGPLVLELAPRFHGDVGTAFVLPEIHGKSPIQAWMATLADSGGPFDEMPLDVRTHAGWMAILPEATGELVAVEGLDAARAMPGITDVFAHKPGRKIASLTDNRAVCGFLWARGSSAVEVEYRLHAARERIGVKVAWPSAA